MIQNDSDGSYDSDDVDSHDNDNEQMLDHPLAGQTSLMILTHSVTVITHHSMHVSYAKLKTRTSRISSLPL